MELRVLRYFLAVAKEESISKAAEVLYITQPTLSRQLMELEEEFGKKLFIRGARKLTLTDEGLLLRKRAEEILELASKTEAEIMSSTDILNGDIYIGSGETDGIRTVMQIAGKIQKEYPRIKYHIFSGNAEDVTEKLDKGILDFGILTGAPSMSKYNSIKLPAMDRWGLLMRKDNILAEKKSIKAEYLSDVPILCSGQPDAQKTISQWAGKDMSEMNLIGTYNLVYNASLMVEEGIGCALCFDNLVRIDEKSSLCFKPLEPELKSELYFIWKKSQVFSKAAQKFLEKVHEEIFKENL